MGDAQTRMTAASAMLILVALACRSGPPPIVLDPDDVSPEGLQRAHGARYEEAWIRPDVDFARYDDLFVEVVSLRYRSQPRPNPSNQYNRIESNFALDDHQMADLRRYFREDFEKELRGIEGVTVHAERPDEGLAVQVGIVDLQVKVPTEARAARETVLTTEIADMTLSMELSDAASGQLLARVLDRKEARNAGAGLSQLSVSNAVADTAAIRLVFRRWARILRERLEAVRGVQ